MKFNDALKEFLAWKKFIIKSHAMSGYVNDLRQLALYLRNPEIEDIRWEDLLKLTDDMTELGWDSNSFVRKFISYRKFFDYWHRKDPRILDPAWIPVKHMEYRQPRVMTEEAYLKLLKVAAVGKFPERNIAILNLLWDTGARVGEIVTLKPGQIDLAEQSALIKTEKSKGKRPFRPIMWTKQTNDNLKIWLVERQRIADKKGFISDALFISMTARHFGQPFKATGVCQLLGILCDKAKIERLNAHSFRHHMGHDIIKKGGSNSDVSNILGHSNLQSSYIYTQMSAPEIHERYKHFKGS